MGEHTAISWTHHTFNPWLGCTKVSPACDHCYAESWAKRAGFPELWSGQRRRTSEAYWRQPLKWNAAVPEGERRRVFCASLADVFDNEVDPAWRADLFRLIEATPNLDWLLLTKRIGNVVKLCGGVSAWPNVWLGITVCNQEEADRDIPKLLKTPARIRFLSIEPMLGPIKFHRGHAHCPVHDYAGEFCSGPCPHRHQVDWVICGGESGPHARPSHPDWFRSLRDQCASARIPFHFKQWGAWKIASFENGHVGHVMPESGERYTWVGKSGRTYNPNAPVGEGCWAMAKVGAKKSGRMLDGREWLDFPEVRT